MGRRDKSVELGNKDEARELLDKAIELGGDAVKTQALNDPDLQGVWVSEEAQAVSDSYCVASVGRDG